MWTADRQRATLRPSVGITPPLAAACSRELSTPKGRKRRPMGPGAVLVARGSWRSGHGGGSRGPV